MPFCSLSEDVSLHYIINTPSGNIADLDPAKATILCVPYMFFDDERLNSEYNLIAFDQRNMGQTRSPPACPSRDTWVDAADLALAHELLQLPPCHILAMGINGTGAALRFALLFPKKCVSICLISVPNQVGDDPEWVPQGYSDLIQAWCYPADLDMWERANMEMLWFLINGQASPGLEDEVATWWYKTIPPRNRLNFYATTTCAVLRPPLSDIELSSIKQPTLVLQGDKSHTNPPYKAGEMFSRLPNATVSVVKGGPELSAIVPHYASVINRIYLEFLRKIPLCTHSAKPSQPDPEGVMKAGLERLADFAGDPSVATRDPQTMLSFCLYSAKQIEQNVIEFARVAEGAEDAFSPLDENGNPIRKLSERAFLQWSPPAFERMKRVEANEVTVMVRTESVSVR